MDKSYLMLMIMSAMITKSKTQKNTKCHIAEPQDTNKTNTIEIQKYKNTNN